MKISVKRLALVGSLLTVIGAATTLVAGVTFGLFSATVAQSGGPNTFTAGKVTLSQSASTVCSVSPMSPGDGTSLGGGTSNNASEVQCIFPVTYTGNVPAYLALDLSIASTAAGVPPAGDSSSPAAGLYDSSATGLQLLVRDAGGAKTLIAAANGTSAGTRYSVSTGFDTATTGANPAVSNLLLYDATAGSKVFQPNHTDTIMIDYVLPATASNSYQQAASSITLTVHAVQANNNANTCTAGYQCPSGSGFSW